jgi:hypothetical protein
MTDRRMTRHAEAENRTSRVLPEPGDSCATDTLAPGEKHAIFAVSAMDIS